MTVYKASSKDAEKITAFLNSQVKSFTRDCFMNGIGGSSNLYSVLVDPKREIFICEDDEGKIRIVATYIRKGDLSSEASMVIESEDFKNKNWKYFREYILWRISYCANEGILRAKYLFPDAYMDEFRNLYGDSMTVVRQYDAPTGKIFLVTIDFLKAKARLEEKH